MERRPGWADLGLLVGPVAACTAAIVGYTKLPLYIGIGFVSLLLARAAWGRRAYRPLWLGLVFVPWVAVVLPTWVLTARRAGRRSLPQAFATRPSTDERSVRRRVVARRPDPSATSLAGRAVMAAGVVVSLLAVNLAVGLLYEQTPWDEDPEEHHVGLLTPEAITATRRDPRVDTVAMRPYPWADTHLREIQRVPAVYTPYLLIEPLSFHGETLTIDGWLRRTYEPAAAGTDPVTIWVFGGSTTYGEGQRDEHTIASELARLAEEAGLPVEVRNYGQRGFVAWQEALLFEQESLVDRPDLAVFYDGANDVAVQGATPTTGVPSVFDENRIARIVTGGDVEGGGAPDEPGLLRRAAAWYGDHSAVHRVVRRFGDASPIELQPGADSLWTGRDLDDICRDALDVYGRARSAIDDLAATRGVTTLHYWQPMRLDNDGYNACLDGVTDPTIRVDDAFDDDQDVYFDAVHHNERGARLVAERMWETLEPAVRAAR